MDFQWFDQVSWDSIKDLRGTTYVQPPTEVQICPTTSSTCHSSSHYPQQPHLPLPRNQPGKRWCSAAGSSWDDLQSIPLRATVPTSWTLGWSFLVLKIGLLFGPWFVLNVMSLQCRTRRAGQKSSKSSHVFAKLLHWPVLVKKEELWLLLEMRPPIPVTEQTVQLNQRVFILQIQSHRHQPQLQFQPSSGLKLLSRSLLRSEKCPGSVNQDLSACVLNIGIDFGSLAGNSDLFVQVVAHIAAAAVPNSVLQHLRAGQITPLGKPTGGHRPLLMMSFLRRLALKSVMAAKKESVAKCAGPLQYGVGRPDGANTMIKTIHYLAEADNSRVLVALDLKAAFQNVSRRAMLHSIAQTDTDLAAVFSRWYTGITEHRMHYDSAYTKITANSGVDQGCPLSACGFSAVVDPTLHSIMTELCTLYDPGAQLFAYLDDWYLWIKPQCLLQTIAVITAATRSVNLALQSTKTQVWTGSCQDPIPPEFQDKVTLTLSCLGGHLQIHGDTEPSPVVFGVSRPPWRKQHNAFRKLLPTLADLNAEGLNVQTVNDLLSMYVGAASQHALRMSFVPEQEAQKL